MSSAADLKYSRDAEKAAEQLGEFIAKMAVYSFLVQRKITTRYQQRHVGALRRQVDLLWV